MPSFGMGQEVFVFVLRLSLRNRGSLFHYIFLLSEPIIRKALTATVMANVSTKTDSAMEAAQRVLKSVAPTDASVQALGTVEDTETVGTNASTS